MNAICDDLFGSTDAEAQNIQVVRTTFLVRITKPLNGLLVNTLAL